MYDIINGSRDKNKMARRKGGSSPSHKQKTRQKKGTDESADKMDVQTFYGGTKDTTGKKGDGDMRKREDSRSMKADSSQARGHGDQHTPATSTFSKALKGKLPTKSKEIEDTFSTRKSKRFVLQCVLE